MLVHHYRAVSQVQATLDSLYTISNSDTPESSLMAAVTTALDPEVGWRANSKKVVLVVSDADFQEAADNPQYTQPYNEDNIIDSSMQNPTKCFVLSMSRLLRTR